MSHLTYYERQKIEFYLKCRMKISQIARLINRNKSVVSREIKRNTGQFPEYFPYSANIAQKAADRRAQKTNRKKLDQDPCLRDWIAARLKQGWSPEQISGRLKARLSIKLRGKTICPETIYQYIYADWQDIYGDYLYDYLRRAKNVRQKRYSRKPKKENIPDRVPIELRPEIVAQKKRIGDWEADTLCFSKQRQAISVHYERKSQLVKLHKLADKGADETIEALKTTLEDLPDRMAKTFTFDNGGENAQHAQLRELYRVRTYFCDAYASWQKGGVENLNGLLRQYLPRKIKLDEISTEQLVAIQEQLNDRPRKSLDFLTPNEMIKLNITKS